MKREVRENDDDNEEARGGDVDAGYEADDEVEDEDEDSPPRSQRKKQRVKRPAWHDSTGSIRLSFVFWH